MAKCSQCNKEVGCACNLTLGLCSTCSGTNFVATKEKGIQKVAQQGTCELTVEYIGGIVDKLSCIIYTEKYSEINETELTIKSLRDNLSQAMLSGNLCLFRPIVQLGEIYLARINSLTVC